MNCFTTISGGNDRLGISASSSVPSGIDSGDSASSLSSIISIDTILKGSRHLNSSFNTLTLYDDDYLYITADYQDSTFSNASSASFTTGKLLIKLYGVK